MVLTTNTSGIAAQLNTTYRCMSSSSVSLGGPGVTVTFFDIRLQAYMPSANLSTNGTVVLLITVVFILMVFSLMPLPGPCDLVYMTCTVSLKHT